MIREAKSGVHVRREGSGKLICRVDGAGSYCHLWSLSVRELEAEAGSVKCLHGLSSVSRVNCRWSS